MGVNAQPLGKNTWMIVVLVLLVFGGKKLTESGGLFNTKSQAENYVNALLMDEKLVLTDHGECRMACRFISQDEVEYILKNGKVNWEKSKPDDPRCPSYALEGKTKDGQHVRIVFADCPHETKVITAIDLDNDYKCDCY